MSYQNNYTYLTKIIVDNEVFKIKKTYRNFTVYYINETPIIKWHPIVRIIQNKKAKLI